MHKAKVLFPTGHRLFRFCVLLFCFCLPLTLVMYGGQYVNIGTVAVIFAAMPVAILLISIPALNAPTSLLQLAGASLALMSLLFFLQEEFRDALSDSWKGALAVVAAVIIYACLYVQRKKRVCAIRTSRVFICVPLMTIVLENGFTGTELSPHSWVLLVCMLCGVCLSVTAVERKKRASESQLNLN